MSVKLNIWQGCETILTDLKNHKVINHFAVYNNQFSKQSEERTFNFPAVLLQQKSIIWNRTKLKPTDNTQGNGQVGILTVTLHIGFQQFENETKAFEIIDETIDRIIEKFHSVRVTDFATPLLRSEERQDADHQNIIVHEVDFTCQVEETFENKNITDATLGNDNRLQLIIS